MTDLSVHAERFAEYLVTRDTRASIDLAVALADDGVPVPDLLTQLVGPAQREVGERWYRNEISVADEHAATAISDAVTSVLSATGPAPSTSSIVVAVMCAEGEWHSLAARLFAEVLRADRHDVTFLGPSMPSPHLSRFVERSPPDVLCVSCSIPLALDGVLSCVHVAHDAGIPVVAGGRALGPDERAAYALGADLWAASAVDAAALLREPLPTTLREPSADTATAIALSFERDNVVAAAMEELARRFPPMATFTRRQSDLTREDFGYTLQFAEAAILTRDPRVFDDYLAWLDGLLVARGLPTDTTAISLAALAAVVSEPALAHVLAGASAFRQDGAGGAGRD